MKNEEILKPIIKRFYDKIINEDFVIDRTGCKMVELICEKIELDPTQPVLDFEIRKTNIEYCKKELEWYLSMDRNIKEISKSAKMWLQVCDKDGTVNSNYGWCIFSKDNVNQYENCLKELLKNEESRRAIMIYNRPLMWEDYNKNGMNDFMCTLNSQYFIRKNILINVHSMRSNDFFIGFFSDFYWVCDVYKKIYKDLKKIYINLETGKIIWMANSLHLYEKHFDKMVKIYEKYKE